MIYDVNGNVLINGESGGFPMADQLGKTILIRHYGGNSAAKLSAAIADGYMAVEGDVHFTSDKKPVMSHDPTLNGLTIATHTLAELQAAGTVYQLGDCMNDCKKYNIFLDIDFSKTYTAEQCQILADHIYAYGMLGRCSIETLKNSSAQTFANISPEFIQNGLGISTQADVDAYNTIAGRCRLLICTIRHADITKTIVDYVHNKGYLAKVWTGANTEAATDTVAQVENFLSMGVDQIIVNTVKPSDITPS